MFQGASALTITFPALKQPITPSEIIPVQFQDGLACCTFLPTGRLKLSLNRGPVTCRPLAITLNSTPLIP